MASESRPSVSRVCPSYVRGMSEGTLIPFDCHRWARTWLGHTRTRLGRDSDATRTALGRCLELWTALGQPRIGFATASDGVPTASEGARKL